MKKYLFFSILLGLAFPLFAKTVYYVEEVQPPSYTYVEEEPPKEIAEEITPSPGPEYIWVKGNWRYDGRWLWVKGRWALRPHNEAVWTPGYWYKKHHHHWVWVPGYWQ